MIYTLPPFGSRQEVVICCAQSWHHAEGRSAPGSSSWWFSPSVIETVAKGCLLSLCSVFLTLHCAGYLTSSWYALVFPLSVHSILYMPTLSLHYPSTQLNHSLLVSPWHPPSLIVPPYTLLSQLAHSHHISISHTYCILFAFSHATLCWTPHLVPDVPWCSPEESQTDNQAGRWFRCDPHHKEGYWGLLVLLPIPVRSHIS